MKGIYLILLCLIFHGCKDEKEYNSWSHYKGSPESLNYSSLDQVDTNNIKQLKVSWEYKTGDADTVHNSQIQTNPIVVDGVLYGVSAKMKLFAIEAGTGKEKWVFNPFDSLATDLGTFFILNNCRGVSYWTDGKEDKRIFYTAGSFLFCINATNGKLVDSFGTRGKIDLHDGLDRDVKDLFITSTSPGIIFKDLIIMGSRVDEGAAAAPGHIRAFDVRTGKRRWIFHTIPHPGETGFDTWDDTTAYKFIGGANVWSGFSLDNERAMVFACTGSASYDWYGGKRLGNNSFANSILALDANTGKLVWHFQSLHHDVWDRDIPAPPSLVTINKDGRRLDVVAVTTKTGYVYVFDRTNGKPVYEIKERDVPGVSDLVGEKLSPTQPFPIAPAPFVRQLFTEKEINPLLSPEDMEDTRKRLLSYKHDHMFHPPSLQGTVVLPGLDGGAEWGGPSVDPETGVLYVNANEMAWVIQAVDIKNKPVIKENYEQAGKRLYQSNCMSCHGTERKGSGNFPTLVDIHKKYSKEAFDSLIQSGRRMMPAFRQLNENEREAIASFVLGVKEMKSKPYIELIKKDDPTRMPYSITGYNKFLTKDGLPALAPPWGTLTAIDLATGNHIWKQTLGHDTAFKNAKAPTGTENYGAAVVTKGGLVLIAATKDGMFRAFNKRSGHLLWETKLPAPAYATPSVYEIDGKQFIVIACGGGKLNTKSADSYVAFSLPETGNR